MTSIPAPDAYYQLTGIFEKYYYLRRTQSVLDWDTAVLLPEGAAGIRGKQVAVLQGVMQELLLDKKMPELLSRARQESEQLSDWQRANLREMQQVYTLNTALPVELRQALIEQSIATEMAWRQARKQEDFRAFCAPFGQLLTLVREKAACLASALDLRPYEALMQEYDWGCREADTERFFTALETGLPPLLGRIYQKHGPCAENRSALKLEIGQQEQLCKRVLVDMGFDFSTGRLDSSVHPFTEGGYQDIRITTTYHEDNVCSALMSTLHEFGHAQYDSNLPAQWHTQPVGRDRGMSIHESMSLFYEMALGRSEAMLQYLHRVYDEYQWRFDGNAFADELLRCRPGSIRLDADEASYTPHIILRYRMEKALLDGSLQPSDIPQCWNQLSETLLGIVPANLLEGCLQDIHWSMGLMGYFPSYAYGAVNASNLVSRMQGEGLALPEGFDPAFFAQVIDWLTERVSSQAAFPSQQALSGQLGLANVPDYLDYLESKYLGALPPAD